MWDPRDIKHQKHTSNSDARKQWQFWPNYGPILASFLSSNEPSSFMKVVQLDVYYDISEFGVIRINVGSSRHQTSEAYQQQRCTKTVAILA
ncbi:hypothetical protein Pyn_24324 [Prunus yedoensis var. nudiflora]|uniref:Uncharacterized protein n=1 Tax=Prunus yedoensis var. nudiflora TaxID=2094558 RepID=A0A314UK32_PRUYE|nr:hypothetical protein Pyn_24324 [Prunus yedoensis var. nudiflora]